MLLIFLFFSQPFHLNRFPGRCLKHLKTLNTRNLLSTVIVHKECSEEGMPETITISFLLIHCLCHSDFLKTMGHVYLFIYTSFWLCSQMVSYHLMDTNNHQQSTKPKQYRWNRACCLCARDTASHVRKYSSYQVAQCRNKTPSNNFR